MKKKTAVSMGLIIANCLNAILWIANLVLSLTEQKTEPKLLLFKIVCAVLWSFTALLSFLRYRKEKTQSSKFQFIKHPQEHTSPNINV